MVGGVAQSPAATLGGTVLDENGAVVPSVEITVLSLSTAVERHATTDGEGAFVVPLLPPGRYTLTAQRDGFATVEVRNIVLNVGDRQAFRIYLEVGEVGEYVTVVDALGAGVEQSSSVSTVVNRQFVENLPLNGRSFQSLFELSPGAVLTRTTFNEQGQFSVNGQRANANYFTVDGVSANVGVSAGAAPGQAAAGGLPALTVLGGANNLVSLDALEEFRLHTSSYAPEFGRTPGAQVAIATRAGTNELHGSLFEYFRDDALDANDWFGNSLGLPRPAIRQHDFGGSLGGPVVHNRAFFFVSYEGMRLRQPRVALTEVPSLPARASAPAEVRPLLEAFPLPNGDRPLERLRGVRRELLRPFALRRRERALRPRGDRPAHALRALRERALAHLAARRRQLARRERPEPQHRQPHLARHVDADRGRDRRASARASPATCASTSAARAARRCSRSTTSAAPPRPLRRCSSRPSPRPTPPAFRSCCAAASTRASARGRTSTTFSASSTSSAASRSCAPGTS